MKKLFTVLLTLLMVFALPMVAMAEGTASTETIAETVAETTEETVFETMEETTPETEGVTDEAPKTSFGFFPATLADTLPVMGMGMLGIFLVTCVIILAVLVLSKFGGKNDEE